MLPPVKPSMKRGFKIALATMASLAVFVLALLVVHHFFPPSRPVDMADHNEYDDILAKDRAATAVTR